MRMNTRSKVQVITFLFWVHTQYSDHCMVVDIVCCNRGRGGRRVQHSAAVPLYLALKKIVGPVTGKNAMKVIIRVFLIMFRFTTSLAKYQNCYMPRESTPMRMNTQSKAPALSSTIFPTANAS